MTFSAICSKVAKMEGKKKEVPVGNIREVVSCLVRLETDHILAGGPVKSSPLKELKRLAKKAVAVGLNIRRMNKRKARKEKEAAKKARKKK